MKYIKASLKFGTTDLKNLEFKELLKVQQKSF